MHFIIVDDFSSDQKKLKELIEKDCAAHELPADFSLFESGEAFLEQYRPGFCEALFLDIMMNKMSGIDTAKAVRKTDERLPIIFTTTEPDFALDGFAVHAMDYLLKPISQKSVSWCLGQLREYLAAPAFIELRAADGRGHSKQCKVAPDDILSAQYQNRNLFVNTSSGVIRTTLSFQEFLSLLPQTGRFYVCGRGVLVNFSQAERIEDGVIRMKNGEMLPFSRRKLAEVQKAYADYQFICNRKGGWA